MNIINDLENELKTLEDNDSKEQLAAKENEIKRLRALIARFQTPSMIYILFFAFLFYWFIFEMHRN